MWQNYRMRFKNWLSTGIALVVAANLSLSSAESVTPVAPIGAVTPGATNPQVTQANIQTTICTSGFTAKIRPSSSYTTNLKRKQLASTYSFYQDTLLGDFEEDHLISLELGGSPTSPLNLWPEPYAGASGARVKDQVENKLHDLVCSGQLTLSAAQRAIAANWWLAYETYVLGTGQPSATQPMATLSPTPPTMPTTAGSTALATPSPSISPSLSQVATWPNGATAKCVDGTYSDAVSHKGACSRHGGVLIFRFN